jgi:hypothetical protein
VSKSSQMLAMLFRQSIFPFLSQKRVFPLIEHLRIRISSNTVTYNTQLPHPVHEHFFLLRLKKDFSSAKRVHVDSWAVQSRHVTDCRNG